MTTDAVNDYIAGAVPAAQPILNQLRSIIRASLPTSIEQMRYGMPSYEYRGRPFVHFAAAKSHVGVYGLVHVDGEVADELAAYLDQRSTLRFRFDQPLPSSALSEAIRRKAAASQ